MRKNKIRVLLILTISGLLQGCSFLVDLAFFNNSNDRIEVCNLNLKAPQCQSIESKSMSKVLLVADMPSNAWRFSISRSSGKGIYDFSFGPYPEHASEVYCVGFIQKRCDIPVQYEEDGLIYWGGKEVRLPVEKFPNQPKGFPVGPNA